MRARLALVLLMAPCLSACRVGGERSVSDENDRLRALVHQQQDQIAALTGERDELKTKLAAPQGTNAALGSAANGLSAEAQAAIPAVTSVDISGLSGFVPADPAKPVTRVAVDFRTLDGRGRFTQAVGTASIQVFSLPVTKGGEPQAIAHATLSPAALRDAYRSGMTGTYYAADIPLEPPFNRSSGVLVRLQFEDAVTGRSHTADRVIGPQGKGSPGG